MYSPQVLLFFLAFLFTTNLGLPAVLARTISPRANPAASVNEQVRNVLEYLSGDPATKIEKPTTTIETIDDLLRARLDSPTKGRKVRILFAEFHGTLGDVGKSMYYLQVLQDQCVNAAVELEALKAENRFFDLRVAIDCKCLQYISNSIKDSFAEDIKACGNSDNDFLTAIQTHMDQFSPDIVIRGHAVEKTYSKEIYEKIRKPIEECQQKDQCALVDIKSFWVDPERIKDDWGEYRVNKNEITIVNQTPEFYGLILPQESKQVLVGRAPTPQQGPLPEELVEWLKSQKRVMYLGHGGKLRPRESKLDSPTPVLQNFVQERLGEDENNDWSFILFHNTPRSSDDNASPITDCQRVYHLWFPQNLLKLWSDPKVEIITHHCGKGSFDDSIIAGKPQICMPQVGTKESFGKDMEYWVQMVQKYKLGAGVPEIAFDTGAPSNEYQGVQVHYEGESEFLDAFLTIIKGLETYKKDVAKLREGLVANTAGPLTVELIKRLALGLLTRNPQKQR